MAATGFTKEEVKQIKAAIENGKMNLKKDTTGATSVADELKKLKELVDAGVLTASEFEQHKAKLLGN